ncbi:hypothetical protein ASG12_18945 [Williamsia sp. Leaf354]|jgi:hypothetical protein|uniref:CHAP domain-containing protein n=1 Tax=Williamsia sp. Leaf354 TaxID=1736349 RepID=UPI0006FD0277|nr:CHAP domain-containing protein [Williamsia sp. Leaf354]KQR96268.1 hypothetical protein ASG12_18945 [Williamsia sp. Leaf354]
MLKFSTRRLIRRASVSVVTLGVGLGLVSTLGIGTAAAAPTARAVVQTQKMSDATLKSRQLGWYAKNSTLTLVCYKRGQAVSGAFSKYVPGGKSDIWYQVNDGGFVADIDISTGTNNTVTGPCGVSSQPAPAAPAQSSGSRESKAISWAVSQVGSQAYNFACQQFVENAFGTRGRYGSAIQMFNALRSSGAIRTGTPPAGALVFSKSSFDKGYGHVALAIGGGRYVSGGMPGPTVNYMSSPSPARSGTYLGWAMAPSSWPGR